MRFTFLRVQMQLLTTFCVLLAQSACRIHSNFVLRSCRTTEQVGMQVARYSAFSLILLAQHKPLSPYV